jgi:cation transporter-like permease
VATDDGESGKVETGKPMPDGLKGLLVTSLVVLVGSLVLFVGSVVAGFVYFSATATPVWVTVLAVAAVLGIALGFVGVGVVFILAVVKARREDKPRAAEQQ